MVVLAIGDGPDGGVAGGDAGIAGGDTGVVGADRGVAAGGADDVRNATTVGHPCWKPAPWPCHIPSGQNHGAKAADVGWP